MLQIKSGKVAKSNFSLLPKNNFMMVARNLSKPKQRLINLFYRKQIIMKTIKLVVFALLFIATSQAQVSVNVNLGKAPFWAPADRVASQYYYLPEIDSYYDVPAQRFIYPNNGKWVRVKKLPKQYRNYNLKAGKVIYITDYRGNSPYLFHKNHKEKYYLKKGGGPAHFFGNQNKYQNKKNHKKYYKNKKHHKHDD